MAGIRRLAWMVWLLALTGCGGVTVGLLSAGGSSSGVQSQPVLSELSVLEAKTSPAEVRFRIRDPAEANASIEILYRGDGGDLHPATLVADESRNIDTNLSGLITAEQGVDHVKLWDFASDVGAQLSSNMQVFIRIAGRPFLVESPPADMGNDPTVMSQPQVPADEVSGIVFVGFSISDTSEDVCSIVAEQGLSPDGPWSPATPAGSFVDEDGFAIRNVVAALDGTDVQFFWDAIEDLGAIERPVYLRLTVNDGTEFSEPVVTDPILIDNNSAPIATLREGDLQLSSDRQRFIPVPFEIRDDESDDVRLLIQWRRPNQSFNDSNLQLPQDVTSLVGILEDPDLREQFQVASEVSLLSEGEFQATGSRTVRVPQFQERYAALANSATLVGLTFEVLRNTRTPQPLAATWDSSPLIAPVDAVPAATDGRTYVLEDLFEMGWAVREVDLATGQDFGIIAQTSEGVASALALEQGGDAVLVASDDAGGWAIRRVDLGSGQVDLVTEFRPPFEAGEILGLASAGPTTALFTVESSLLRVDYGDGMPRIRPVIAPNPISGHPGLQTPWGIAIDPVDPGRVYVAEQSAGALPGRVISVDLDTARITQLNTLPGGAITPRPEGLACDAESGVLYVVTDSDDLDGVKELVALDLSTSAPVLLSMTLSDDVGGLATGPDGLVIVSEPLAVDLLVAGGREQQREITAYDPGTQSITLAADFDPPLDTGTPLASELRRWRIEQPSQSTVQSTSFGVAGNLLWDSSEVPGQGSVFLRIVPMDTDVGAAGEMDSIPKQTRHTLRVDPQSINDMANNQGSRDIAAADLDGDGDLDLLTVDPTPQELSLFLQNEPREFIESGKIGDPTDTPFPFEVEVADFDADGDLDLVITTGVSVVLYEQTAPGGFTLQQAIGPSVAANLVAGDFDHDGTNDFVINQPFDELVAYFQTGAWTFSEQTIRMPGFANSLSSGDLNGDGRLDLAFTEEGDDRVTVVLQTGFRQYADQITFDLLPELQGPTDCQFVDLENDGLTDLVVPSRFAAHLTLFRQDPGGGMFSVETIGDQNFTVGPRSVAAGDVDGDGDVDLASCHPDAGRLVLFHQLEGGAFAPDPDGSLGDPSTLSRALRVELLDLDADGRLDALTANEANNKVAMFFQERRGTFPTSPHEILGGRSVVPGLRDLSGGDLDGDGDFDLVATSLDNSLIQLFEQVGPGRFVLDPRAPLITSDAPWSVRSADFEGDGDADIAYAGADDVLFATLVQGADGQFTEVQQLGDGMELAEDIDSLDVNQDGLLDFVVSTSMTDQIHLFLQTSPGTFAQDTPISDVNIADPFDLEVADLNGDGLLDLAVASYGNSSIPLYIQSGSGLVAGPVLSSGATGPIALDAGDFDGDGTVDLAVCYRDSGVLTLFLQQSPGVFTEGPVLSDSVVIDPSKVMARDLDLDGDLDLVVARSFDPEMVVFHQVAPGEFRPFQRIGSFGQTNNATRLMILDVDSDEDEDLIVASLDFSHIALFFGGH